jgi:hypothetical protein
MAPLTWRNVNAPDFSSSARILGDAGRGLGDGFDSISGVFKDARERQINTRSNEGIGQLAGATNESDVERIMAQVLGSVSARDRNGALNNAIMGSTGRALGLEGDRADIRNTENMISNRNAASGRAATAAARLEEQRAAYDKHVMLVAANNKVTPGEVLSDSPGTLRQTPVGGTVSNTGSSTPEAVINSSGSASGVGTPIQKVTPAALPTQPINPGMGSPYDMGGSGSTTVAGGAGEDLLGGGGDPVDNALQAAMGRRSLNPDITNSIDNLSRGNADGFSNSDVGLGQGNPMEAQALLSQGMSPDTNLPGQDSFIVREGSDQARAAAQDKALAQSIDYFNGNLGSAPNANIATAFQDQYGQAAPDGVQSTGLETLTTPEQQVEIDQAIEVNTDPETGEPVSAEASDQIGQSVYDMLLESGYRPSMEELNGLLQQRKDYLKEGKDRKQKAYTAEVDANIYAEMNKLGSKGGEKLRQLILNNPDLTARDRDAYLKSLERFTSAEGEYNSRLTSTGTEFVSTAAERKARENDAFNADSNISLFENLDFAGQSLESLGSEGNLDGAVDTIVASGDEGDLSRATVRGLLQEYYDNTGVPYSFIVSQMDASLTGKWWDTKVGISRDILDSRLAPFLNDEGRVDADKITGIRSAARSVESIKTDRALAQSEIDAINAEYRVLLDRPKSPQIDALIQELKVKHGRSVAVLNEANIRAEKLFKNGSDAPTVELTPAEKAAAAKKAADAALAAASDTQENIPANTPTQRGWEVDPDQSNVRQAINQHFGTKDVENTLTRIIGKLGGEGAYPGNEFFGSFFDNFQSQESATADSDNRRAKREVSDWYKSKEAQELFYTNPILAEEAEKDPTAFYEERMKNR